MNKRERNILRRLKSLAGLELSRNQGGPEQSATALDDGFNDGEVCLSRYLLETYFTHDELRSLRK